MPRDHWKATATGSSGTKHRDEKASGRRNKGKIMQKRTPRLFFKLIQSQQWDECRNWCSAHPEYIHSFENGQSVLHCALQKRPEISDPPTSDQSASFLSFVDHLMGAAPQLLCAVDGLGYTPLHVVCSKNPCAVLVRRLLHRCPPTAVSLKEMISNPIPLEIAVKILEFVPNPCLLEDAHGKTPLFLACQRSKNRKNERLNADVVRLLFLRAPEAATAKDKTGRSPLDIVRRQRDSEDILDILTTAPEPSQA